MEEEIIANLFSDDKVMGANKARMVDDYMKLPYRLEIVEDTEEGGYVASFPDLKGCITCADAADEVLRLAMDAKNEWLKAAIEDGYDIPLPKKSNV